MIWGLNKLGGARSGGRARVEPVSAPLRRPWQRPSVFGGFTVVPVEISAGQRSACGSAVVENLQELAADSLPGQDMLGILELFRIVYFLHPDRK